MFFLVQEEEAYEIEPIVLLSVCADRVCLVIPLRKMVKQKIEGETRMWELGGGRGVTTGETWENTRGVK